MKLYLKYDKTKTKNKTYLYGKNEKLLGSKYKKYNVIVLTKLKQVSEQNEIGAKTFTLNAGSVVNAETLLEEGDISVIYGNKNDIKAMIDKNM